MFRSPDKVSTALTQPTPGLVPDMRHGAISIYNLSAVTYGARTELQSAACFLMENDDSELRLRRVILMVK